MSKIICDVCGTSYPETATQCPICGCVRPGDPLTVSGGTGDKNTNSESTYTYVKGGRFSKANVKKRNQANAQRSLQDTDSIPDPEPSNKKGEKGLVVAVIVLLIALIAVIAYITIMYFIPMMRTNDDVVQTTPTTINTVETTQATEETTVPETTAEIVMPAPCESIQLSASAIKFDTEGQTKVLEVITTPEVTEETPEFKSSDEAVATVSETGEVVAVGNGTAVITVVCGAAQAQCDIECTFETVEETADPNFDISTMKFNWSQEMIGQPGVGDVTMTNAGTTWAAYTNGSNKVPSSEIKFSSSDESVVTIDQDGVVTAVGEGEAYIYAEYQGNTVKCRIICYFG